jgi:hypothetical protein
MNVTFSTDKTEVKFKGVNYFKQNMTRDAFVLHIAKSQEFVVFFHELSVFNQIRARDLAASQPRPAPSPLY